MHPGIRALYDTWADKWPPVPTNRPIDYIILPDFGNVRRACSESQSNMEFLVRKMEADPEFNRGCLVVYDIVAPPDLVVPPSNEITMTRAAQSVKLYRSVYPFVPPSRIVPRRLYCGTIIAFCGPMLSGKSTAARAVGTALVMSRMYNVRQWSFAALLKNFCMRYYDGDTGAGSEVMDAYFNDKCTIPPSARRWAESGSPDLPPASVIPSMFASMSAENAEQIRKRLFKVFTVDLQEKPQELCGRRIMQVTGSVFRDVCGPDFWVDQLANLMCAGARAGVTVDLIDDVRFPNEAMWLKSMHAVIIRIMTPHTPRDPPKHISEMCCDEIPADFVFNNPKRTVANMTKRLMPFVMSAIRDAKSRRCTLRPPRPRPANPSDDRPHRK